MAKLGDENSLVPKYLQEDELGKECKELIQTLPLEKGWISTHFHQYQGFWIGTRILQGVLSCQKHFQALNTDILLVTTPKSGTTWLKALTFALINRKKYQNIHNFNHPLLTSNPHVLVPFLEVDLYYDKDYVPNLNSLSPPRLFATHIPYELLPKSVKESSCKVVYLCRDPKDTFASLWYFSNKVRSNKVMLLRFEEMKMKPDFHLKKLAEFLECPFTKDEESKGVVDDILNLCSFEKLSNLEVNKTGKVSFGVENKAYFRRGQVGDGEKLLTTEMIEQLNTVIEEKLVKHGFNF